METPVAVAIIALIAATVSGFFAWRTSGRANDRTADLGWAKEIRQDAIDARREVAALRAEVQELRSKVEVANREVDRSNAEHLMLRRHIHDPAMTIERLRELAPRLPENY